MINPKRPSSDCLRLVPVKLFALSLILSRLLTSTGSDIAKFKLIFSLFNALANTSSLLITFNPIPDNVLAETQDLPEPGPPARKNALKILGSYTPSVMYCSKFLIHYYL